MAAWTAFPQTSDFPFTAASVKKHWAQLHAGDCEPCPSDKKALEAWALFHSGQFEQATTAGLAAGNAGVVAANKAQAIYATYLEPKEKVRLEMFQAIAERAQALTEAEPGNANAWYQVAYALGRYSQDISVAKALAQGLGQKIKAALEQTLALAPDHAEAHIALGAFHAEVIDKVGALIGGMTYGAKKDLGLKHFKEALRLQPDSAIAKIEYANALVMLDGDKKMKEATALYEQAAASVPQDAMEFLDVELARAELSDD